ncbi:DUF1643 domain-containing protein [Terriglobus saanensis]|uniref:DUF1643 domain-containing protein n=1 Tax=Terriglobus saanensis (strain ATCC BAA-1853 / DSM 23119 / SP1PR4) TaxID=401053 RepID=E8V8F9_TERSS|nr:DUF1643 domain-containing protein [Terriglobus saanensis]ADV82938.1 protein of unknown function DUF1643 [Terriglobus saanensis SP1PR4]
MMNALRKPIEVSAKSKVTPPHDPGGKSKPRWPADSNISAHFSPCKRYRYTLTEIWDSQLSPIMWLLMNPSVASVEHADPTLIRTGRYARLWGYGGQLVGNVHAYRTTDKHKLLDVDDPEGPENVNALVHMAKQAGRVILAYGQPPKVLRPRSAEVVQLLRETGATLHHLRLSKDGSPSHPLYLPATLGPTPPLPKTSVLAAG